MAASSFSFQWKVPTQNRDFPRFLALFQFRCIFEGGNPGASKNPKWDLPNSCGAWDMAVGSLIFIGKYEGGPNKNRNFLNLRFSDPLKGQNSPPEGPKVPKRSAKGVKKPQMAPNRILSRPIIKPWFLKRWGWGQQTLQKVQKRFEGGGKQNPQFVNVFLYEKSGALKTFPGRYGLRRWN